MSHEIKKTININKGISQVSLYVRDVAHLADWSNFFTRIIKRRNNVACFETKLGEAISTIVNQYDENHLTIMSKFKANKHRDAADIYLHGLSDNICELTLVVKPKFNADEQFLNELEANMTAELSQLKKNVEATYE